MATDILKQKRPFYVTRWVELQIAKFGKVRNAENEHLYAEEATLDAYVRKHEMDALVILLARLRNLIEVDEWKALQALRQPAGLNWYPVRDALFRRVTGITYSVTSLRPGIDDKVARAQRVDWFRFEVLKVADPKNAQTHFAPWPFDNARPLSESRARSTAQFLALPPEERKQRLALLKGLFLFLFGVGHDDNSNSTVKALQEPKALPDAGALIDTLDYALGHDLALLAGDE